MEYLSLYTIKCYSYVDKLKKYYNGIYKNIVKRKNKQITMHLYFFTINMTSKGGNQYGWNR